MVDRTHERPGRRAVASGDLERQTDKLYSTRSDPLQVKPFDDPDAGLEQGLVGFDPIGSETADREIVDADQSHLPLDEILGRRCRKVHEVLDKTVGSPAVIRVVGLEQDPLAAPDGMPCQLSGLDGLPVADGNHPR